MARCGSGRLMLLPLLRIYLVPLCGCGVAWSPLCWSFWVNVHLERQQIPPTYPLADAMYWYSMMITIELIVFGKCLLRTAASYPHMLLPLTPTAMCKYFKYTQNMYRLYISGNTITNVIPSAGGVAHTVPRFSSSFLLSSGLFTCYFMLPHDTWYMSCSVISYSYDMYDAT